MVHMTFTQSEASDGSPSKAENIMKWNEINVGTQQKLLFHFRIVELQVLIHRFIEHSTLAYNLGNLTTYLPDAGPHLSKEQG